MIKPLIAGNWKMNGFAADLDVIAEIAAGARDLAGADAMICPPATLIRDAVARSSSGGLSIGGQDCHVAVKGAHTGDISAAMIADCGATAVIVGHSERRSDHGETSRTVRAKAEAARAAGLVAIVCVGETAGERATGLTVDVVLRQLLDSLPGTVHPDGVVVAYEPVWAIGTGLTATTDDVADVHTAMRNELVARHGETGHRLRLLYGGSVKPDNAAELLAVADVNGALVGGASLKAADFLAIVRAGAAVGANA